ncbi:MAG TPA: hypothetical protein VK897_17285 [Anaerolineales bacterium]|nr:hypothetical protein [Anaerolineales bacterium]
MPPTIVRSKLGEMFTQIASPVVTMTMSMPVDMSRRAWEAR